MTPLEEHLQNSPEDSAAWNVYADWLLEHGDARGELVHRDRAPEPGEIAAWRGMIPEKAIARWRFGFAVEIALPLDVRTPDTLAKILADPAARFVSTLRFHATDSDTAQYHVDPKVPDGDDDKTSVDLLGAIAALDLRRVRTLSFAYYALGEPGMHALAAAKQIGPLVALELGYCKLDNAAMSLLANAPWLRGVRELYVQRNLFAEAGARALAASPHVADLEVLDVRYNAIGAAGARALAALGKLTALLAYPDDVAPDGIRALAASPSPAVRRYWSTR